MWSSLSLPWKKCFEQGWEAYCSGSIPIGATIVNSRGEILSVGRSMQHEKVSTEKHQIVNHPLSHAEVNALLGLNYNQINPHDCILFSMVEPCPLCIGALAMARLKNLKYAARDPYGGSVALISSSDYLIKKQIKIEGPQDADFEDVITALQIEFFLRTQRSSADRVMRSWQKVLERGVSLGIRIQESGELYQLAKSQAKAEDALGFLYTELGVD
jgi:tRNA(Arg) A34 adenosine deaminase TadA